MKIDIIIVYMPRYRKGHEMNFVPPITGIHLAALTPQRHRVRVFHQQLDPIPLRHGRRPGRPVLLQRVCAGGLSPGAALQADGENRDCRRAARHLLARRSPGVLRRGGDRRGRVGVGELLQRRRAGPSCSPSISASLVALEGLPTPRYDLLSPASSSAG